MEDMSPTEPGTYPAKITECPFQTSKAGNPMIVPVFEIKVGDSTKTRRTFLVTEGKGTAGFDALLRACHFDKLADQYRNGEQVPFDTDQLIGQELNVVIDQEMYAPEGGTPEPRDRIKTFMKK
jgi:hypothetical protein